MAISASLAVTPSAPAHGGTVTATYTVSGNDGSPGTVLPVTGQLTVGGTQYNVSATITSPGGSPLPETFSVPQCSGLIFTATSQPNVFIAVVP